MANLSLKEALARYWQHVTAAIGTSSDNALANAKQYTDNKITSGTNDLEDGVSALPTGTLYLIYEEE